MKKLLPLLAVLTLATAALAANTRNLDIGGTVKALNGSPTYLGRIASTTSTTNLTTAVPFTLEAGTQLLIQCDAAADVLETATVTAATGVKLAADEKFYLMLKPNPSPVLAAIGTANCDVWSMD